MGGSKVTMNTICAARSPGAQPWPHFLPAVSFGKLLNLWPSVSASLKKVQNHRIIEWFGGLNELIHVIYLEEKVAYNTY